MTDYLDWQSKLTLEEVFAGTQQPAYPVLLHNGVLYLAALSQEQGRMVIMYQRDGVQVCLTPPPFNLRTKFSEYGGKPFWVDGGYLYFVNQADQCVYRQFLPPAGLAAAASAGPPQRITPLPDQQVLLMYAELVRLTPQTLLMIVERQPQGASSDRDNTSCIAMLNPGNPDREPAVLIQGADFYSNLCVDRSHQRLAWVQWQHPNMPWDETELWTADYVIAGQTIKLDRRRRIPLDKSASVCQLLFANNGKLFFSADFSGASATSSRNFWNIYALDMAAENNPVVPVTGGQPEFGYPHWQYGDTRIAMLDAHKLVSFATGSDGDTLVLIDQDSLQVRELQQAGTGYQHLSADGAGSASAVMLSKQSSPALARLSAGQSRFRPLDEVPAVLAQADMSVAEHFSFPTGNGEIAYGYYYAPRNAAYTLSGAEVPPPLLVMVHGGPTARAHGFFDIQKQFWTQRGFAIFDVNHRGSSGYGRAYRDALYGHWGEKDCCDIVKGIKCLVSQGKAAVEQICIRGKSAGGYAVLRALTEYPQVFKAGACYYGIGNLATLAELTHKFEKYYTDRMIGEAYDAHSALAADSLFQQRSPINNMHKLQSAMIVFQGLQDKVVPPAVAHEIINTLKTLGLAHSYVEYADEGHGFRQAANNIDAWTRELEFYRANLKK